MRCRARTCSAKWPAAKISWLVTPAAPVAGRTPDARRGDPSSTASVSATPGGARRRPWRCGASIAGCAARQFDLVIDLQGLFRSGWLAWRDQGPGADRVRQRPRAGVDLLYPSRADEPGSSTPSTAISGVGRGLGCGPAPVEFPFATTDADRAAVAAMLPRGQAVCACCCPAPTGRPSAGRSNISRRWSGRCGNDSGSRRSWPAGREIQPLAAQIHGPRSDRQDQSAAARRRCWKGPIW